MTDAPSNYPHLREVQRIVWHKECTLSAIARAIAAYLLNRMNQDYEGAFPSVARTADDMGFGRDTVIKYTKELVDSGLFERKARRRGMYTYRVKDMDRLCEMMDAKMEEWTKDLWAGLKPSGILNGGSDRPVGHVDQSVPPTPTSRPRRPVPVGHVDTERDSLKGQVKAQYSAHPTDEPATNPQMVPASDSLNLEYPVGVELQMQEPEVVEFGEGIPWVEASVIPPTYAQAVWFDRTIGKLFLVSGPKGSAFYKSLRDEPQWTPDIIARAISNAGARAPSTKARGGGLEALVRTYCGYALEKRQAAGGAARARETAFQKPRAFQP